MILRHFLHIVKNPVLHSRPRSRRVSNAPSPFAMASQTRLGEYRRHVQSRYAPVVCAVSTDDADKACSTSGHRFVDLLRPFQHVHGINVPIAHNPGETPPYTLSEFQVRFCSLNECRRVTHEQAEVYVKRAFDPWDRCDDEGLAKTMAKIPNEIGQIVAIAKAGDDTAIGDGLTTQEKQAIAASAGEFEIDQPNWWTIPWFDTFVERTKRTTNFSEFDTTDHPKAMLFVSSFTRSGDPNSAQLLIQSLENLSAPYYQNPKSYPPLVRSEAADPDVVKHFIVLVENGEIIIPETLSKLNEAFGDGNVTILPINSGRPEGSAAIDIWSSGREAAVCGDSTGVINSETTSNPSPTHSDADVATHKQFVETFTTKHLLPHLEKKLTALNQNISNTRKGLKNQLKTFWGRSVGSGVSLNSTFGGLIGGTGGGSSGNLSSQDVGKSNGDSGYSFRSPESEIRLAADLAFSLFDHELSASHLKLLQSDYKADKAWRRLGSTHESLAQALALQGGGVSSAGNDSIGKDLRREIDLIFEAAAGAHGKAVVDGDADAWRHEKCAWTTRALLSHAVFLSATGAHRDAAAPLTKASGEESQSHFAAAGFLEAASVSFLKGSSGKSLARKFAMHAVLAGHRYAQGGLRAHAVRCYAMALPAYRYADGSLTSLRAACASSDRVKGGDSSVSGNSSTSTSSTSFDAADKHASHWHVESSVKTPWSRAREHLHFALGRQIAKCGGLPTSELHFKRLLQCVDQNTSEVNQATYLQEYMLLSRESKTGYAGVSDHTQGDASPHGDGSRSEDGDHAMPLPEIDVGDVAVRLRESANVGTAENLERAISGLNGTGMGNQSDDEALLSSPSNPSSPTCIPPCATWSDSQWRVLEVDGVIPPWLQSTIGATWLDKPKQKGSEQVQVCAAGEFISLFVTVRNPLKVPLVVRDVSLVCSFFGTDTPENDTHEGDVATPGVTKTLAPIESKMFTLTCVPRRSGSLRVKGIGWSLGDADCAPGVSKRGYRAFDVRAPLTRRGKDGVSWIRDVPVEKRLTFAVTPAMPRLAVSLENVPSSMPAGSIAIVTLRVRNIGIQSTQSTPTSALRVRVRAPGNGAVTPKYPDQIGLQSNDSGNDGLIFQPPTWSEIKPGDEVTCELLLRPSTTGFQNLPFVVCYEPPEPAPATMRYRISQLASGVSVSPSLDVVAKVSNFVSNPAAKLVRIGIRNVSDDSGSEFKVKAVRLIGHTDGSGTSEAHDNSVRLRSLVPNKSAPIISQSKRWDAVLVAEPFGKLHSEDNSQITFEDSSDTLLRSCQLGVTKTVTKDLPTGGLSDVLASRDLVIEWERISKSDGKVVSGAHVVRDVGVTKTPYAQLAGRDPAVGVKQVVEQLTALERLRRTRDQVRWTLEGPCFANFSSKNARSVVVQLKVTVFNPSSCSVKVTFEALSSGIDRNDNSNATVNHHGWSASGVTDQASGQTVAGTKTLVGLPLKGPGVQSSPVTGVANYVGVTPYTTNTQPLNVLTPGRAWVWHGPVRVTVTVPPGQSETICVSVAAFAAGVFSLDAYRLVSELIDPTNTTNAPTVLLPHHASDSPFVLTVT